MSILITGVTVDNLDLDLGDEIGVFDGNVCVGSATYNDESVIGISVSMVDPLSNKIDGFKLGKPISFKIWKQKMDFEYINIQTHFDASFDTVFRSLGTALVDLKTFINQQRPKIYPNQLFSVAENASQSTVIGTVKVDFSQGDLHFELLHPEQNKPFSIDSLTGSISVVDPAQFNYTDTQKLVLSVHAY